MVPRDISWDSRFRTSNDVIIVDGLRVWDYDCKPGTVSYRESNMDSGHWRGWFHVMRDDGSGRSMNGERLRTRHWTNGSPVPAAPEDPTRAGLLAALDAGAELHATHDAEPVTYDPRVPDGRGDPLPWRGERTYRRYASNDVSARTPGDKPGHEKSTAG
jgi:hypothetical protein